MSNIKKSTEMNTNDLTPEKSLQLISGMIAKSRKDFEKDSGTPMNIWGLTVTAVAIVIWILMKETGNGIWNLLWFAIPVIGYPVSYLMIGRKRENRAKNFLNESIGQIWKIFGIVSMLLAAIAVLFFNEMLPVLTALIILVLGFSTALTGMLLKNYYIAGGGMIVAIAGTILAIILPRIACPLILSGSAIVSLIIPGIILNIKSK